MGKSKGQSLAQGAEQNYRRHARVRVIVIRWYQAHPFGNLLKIRPGPIESARSAEYCECRQAVCLCNATFHSLVVGQKAGAGQREGQTLSLSRECPTFSFWTTYLTDTPCRVDSQTPAVGCASFLTEPGCVHASFCSDGRS